MSKVEEYQEAYDLLRSQRNDLNKSMKIIKDNAEKDGVILVNGSFVENSKVLFVKYKWAQVTRYVGEKGTMYRGRSGAVMIKEEDKENFFKLLIFLSEESNRTQEAYDKRIQALGLEDYTEIFEHEYGEFFLTEFDTVIDFSIKDENFEGDSSECTPDEVEDFYFTMEAKGGEHGAEDQFHDDSSFELVYGSLSDYEAIPHIEIEDEFDISL